MIDLNTPEGQRTLHLLRSNPERALDHVLRAQQDGEAVAGKVLSVRYRAFSRGATREGEYIFVLHGFEVRVSEVGDRVDIHIQRPA